MTKVMLELQYLCVSQWSCNQDKFVKCDSPVFTFQPSNWHLELNFSNKSYKKNMLQKYETRKATIASYSIQFHIMYGSCRKLNHNSSRTNSETAFRHIFSTSIKFSYHFSHKGLAVLV